MPPSLTAWRTRTASNQPQRRGRPVTVPNSRPRSPIRRPVSSCSSVGKGPAPDAGRVGLADAEHEADAVRADAGAAGGGGRHRVRGGDERVGAVVDVEHRALGALEQDAAPGAPQLGEAQPDRLGEREELGRQRGQLAQQLGAVDLLDAEAAAQRVVVQQQLVQLGLERRRVGEVAESAPPGAPPCPRRPGRCRGRWCRSCRCPRRCPRGPARARGRARRGAAGSAARSRRCAASRPRSRRPGRAGSRSRAGAPRGRPRRRCR